MTAGGSRERDDARRLGPTLQFDDAINIQFTSGTTGFPKGATLSHHNILNNGYLRRRGIEAHARRPPLHPGAALPLLRHGDGQSRLPDPRRDHGLSGRGLRSAGHAAGRRRGALHRALRRADHVHRRARPSRVRRVRPREPAHRHHGRLALPDRGDEARAEPDAHARGHHRLRHDRDLAGLDPVRHRRPVEKRVSTVGQVLPHVEIKIVDAEGQVRAARRDRRVLHPRLLRDEGLLERRGRRRARPSTTAGWMHTGDLATMDARRLRQHRRPAEGHGDPRRRERLSARDRGVPLPPSRRSRTCR